MESKCLQLQEMCFNVIIGEFSWFTSIFLKTVDESLKKNFLFLQRVYSQDLLDELIKRGELKEDHLVFLLNIYLKKIDLDSLLRFTNKENLIEKVVPISHSLTELTSVVECVAQDIRAILAAVLPHLTSVRKLSIPGICNDEMLKIIVSSCPHLIDLDIHESHITSLGLQTLCTGPGGAVETSCSLTHLNLIHTDATYEDVGNILKNIPTLQELIFRDVPGALYLLHESEIVNNVLREVKKYNLTSLSLYRLYDDFVIEKLLKICAELCPHLKKLCIPVTKTTDFQLCSLFTELESITVVNYYLACAYVLNSFVKIKGEKLKNVNATCCSLSVSTLVQNCPNLVSVRLMDCKYTRPDRNIREKLNFLQVLVFDLGDFYKNRQGEVSLEMLLSASPNLEKLELVNCNFIKSEIVHMLTRYFAKYSLKHLSFTCSDVKYDLLEQMVLSCCKLQSLSIVGCKNISPHDMKKLIRRSMEAFNRKIKVCFIDDHTDSDEFENDFVQEVYDSYDKCDLNNPYDYYAGFDESDSEYGW